MGEGLLALVGVGRGDAAQQARELARRLVNLRIFPDSADASEGMQRSLLDTGGSLGVVSQFTLYGDVRKGRRPSFVEAAPAAEAAPLIETLIDTARELGVTVITGRFQAMMDVTLVNTGPVTLLLDSDKRF